MEDELTGYLHYISPLKKGSKTTWFDMQILCSQFMVRAEVPNKLLHILFLQKLLVEGRRQLECTVETRIN